MENNTERRQNDCKKHAYRLSAKWEHAEFISLQDGTYTLGKTYMCSTPSLRSFPNIAFETVKHSVFQSQINTQNGSHNKDEWFYVPVLSFLEIKYEHVSSSRTKPQAYVLASI